MTDTKNENGPQISSEINQANLEIALADIRRLDEITQAMAGRKTVSVQVARQLQDEREAIFAKYRTWGKEQWEPSA